MTSLAVLQQVAERAANLREQFSKSLNEGGTDHAEHARLWAAAGDAERDVHGFFPPEVLVALCQVAQAARDIEAADTRLLLCEMETPNDKEELAAAQANYSRKMHALGVALGAALGDMDA